MNWKTIVEDIGTKKGLPLLNAARDLHRFVNKHGAFYTAIRTAAGKPLPELTDDQINNYFGVILPDDVLIGIRKHLDAFETMMTTIKDKVDALPADDMS
ncbi:hypothetical protein KAR91_36910 [Candidatus Pacearchaeota archaeon]|nr:hypothetical protein [Candidatus Pacearchaeota archaeon]